MIAQIENKQAKLEQDFLLKSEDNLVEAKETAACLAQENTDPSHGSRVANLAAHSNMEILIRATQEANSQLDQQNQDSRKIMHAYAAYRNKGLIAARVNCIRSVNKHINKCIQRAGELKAQKLKATEQL